MAIDLNVDGVEPFFYILIGGIGIKEGSEAKQLYTFTRVPNWSPSATQKFIDGLHIPAEWSQNVDLWGGVASGSNLTLEIQDFRRGDDTYFWCELFALGRWAENPAVLDADGNLVSGLPQTFVTSTCSRMSSRLEVQSARGFKHDSGTNAERTIIVGNETITYTDWDTISLGSGEHPGQEVNRDVFLGLTRNRFPAIGDLPLEHIVQEGQAGQLPVVTTIPRTMFGRTVGLYCGLRYPDGTWSVEGQSVRLFAGTIQSAEWVSSRSLWRLQCDDMLSMLDQRVCTYIGSRRQQSAVLAHIAPPAVPAVSSTIRGIHLPAPTAYKTMSVRVRRMSDNAIVIDSSYVPKFDYYSTPQALILELNKWLSPLTTGSTALFIRSDDDLTWRVELTAGEDIHARLKIGRALAFMLGYSMGQKDYNETLVGVAQNDTEPWPTEWTMQHAMWARDNIQSSDGQRLRLDNTGYFYFNATQGGDGAKPAVIVNGRKVLRYEGLGVESGINPADPYGAEYLDRIDTDLGTQDLNDYGSNRWSRVGDGVGSKMGEDTGRTVAQCLAPNPDHNVLILILRLALSTGYGTVAVGTERDPGFFGYTQNEPLNGIYDVYYPGIGVGIPEGLIDTASFLTVAAALPASLLRRSYVFTSAFSLREFIDKEGKLLGFTVAIQDGQITARVVPSIATTADLSTDVLNEDNRSSEDDRTSSQLSTKNIINAATIKYAYEHGATKFWRELNLNYPVSQTENRVTRAIGMENQGLHGNHDQDLTELLTTRQVLYGWPLWNLRRSYVYRMWTTIAPGQIVYITDGDTPESGVPDPFVGKLGLTDRFAAITGVSYNYKGGGGTVDLVLLQMQGNSTRTTGTTMDMQWSRGDGGWDSATSRIYVWGNNYTTSPAFDNQSVVEGMRFRVTDMSATDDTPPMAWVVASGPIFVEPYGFTIAGQDLNALMPGGFITTHRYSIVEDPYGGDPPTTTEFYFRDAVATGSNFGKMTRDDSSGITSTITGTGWTVGTTAPTVIRAVQYGAEVAGFGAPTAVLPPDNAAANGWRSEATLTGTIPAGTWTLTCWVQAVTAGGSMDGALIARLYRSTSATGVGATDIGGADITGTTVTNLTTAAPQLSTISATFPAVTFAGEYLFASLVWVILGSGGGATHDCLIKVGDTSGTWTRLLVPLMPAVNATPTSALVASSDTSQLLPESGRWDPFT